MSTRTPALRAAALRLRPRSAAALTLVSAVGLAAFTWPLFVQPGTMLARGGEPWLFVLLLPMLIAVVLAEMADGGMDAKAVALLGVLAAVGAALRPLGTGVAGFQPMLIVFIFGGRVLGRGFGFVLGAVAMFASALLTGGVGPWLPYEMLGAAWMGFFAGCLPRSSGRAELALLAAYAAVASLAYGTLLNLWFWPFATAYAPGISFEAGAPLLENLQRFLAFDLATSLGFDIPRAVATAALVALTGRPVLLALRRAARRAAFDTPARFSDRPRGAAEEAGRRSQEAGSAAGDRDPSDSLT